MHLCMQLWNLHFFLTDARIVCVCAGVDGCVLHVDPKDAAQLVRHPHHHPSRREHHLPGPVPLCLGAGVALGQPPAAQRAAHHQPCPGLVSLLGVVCAGCVICLSLATVTVFYSLFLDRSVRLGLCLVKLLCVLLLLLHTSTHMYMGSSSVLVLVWGNQRSKLK